MGASKDACASDGRRFLDPLPVLATDDLHLRQVHPRDAEQVRDITFYDGVAATSPGEAWAMIERIVRDQQRGETLHWGLCLRGSDQIVGTCGFYRGFSGDVGEVGYVLRDAHRGRGLMTQAVRRIVTFGLDELGLRRVVAHVDRGNVASMGVLARAHFVRDTVEGNTVTYVRCRAREADR